ncbi:hypothetical protein GCM10009872_38140 [Actinopolymorpha rutila]
MPRESSTAAEVTGSMSPEVAFGRPELATAGEGRFSLDRLGRRVVFQVHTPPETAPAGQPRFLPSGTPACAVGQMVHYVDLDGGGTVQVGPDGANSWHPSWSPDGQTVAFYSDAGGSPNLWVHDVASGTSRLVSKVGVKAKLWVGDEPQWVPDGSEVLVPVAPDEEGTDGEEAASPAEGRPTARVYRSRDEPDDTGSIVELNEHYLRENNATIAAINIADGSVRVLVAADATPRPSAAQVSPSGRWVSYLSVALQDQSEDAPTSGCFHDLLLMSTAGGHAAVVASHIAQSESPPGYYLDTYIWHPTRDQLFWIDQGRLWTVEIDDKPGQPRRLAPSLDTLTVTPLLLTRTCTSLIIGIGKGEQATTDHNPVPHQLGVVPLDGSPHTVIAPPTDLADPYVVRQSHAVAWEPQPGAIAVQMRNPSTTEPVLLRVDTTTATITRSWQGPAKLDTVGATPDHRSLVAAYEDFRHPRDLWILDSEGHRERQLTTVNPLLSGVRLGEVDTFQTRVPQHDGTFADATTAVLLPAGVRRGDHLPAIMFCYPGGRVSHRSNQFGGGMPSCLPLTPFFDRGYAVLLAEAPIGPDGQAGNPRAELAAVLVPQLYHAAELGYIDLERVALSGHSYGGYGTAATISATNAFAAAVALQGMYDLTSSYSRLTTGTTTSMYWYFETGQARMGAHPWKAPQRYHDNSPYHQADRIQTPLLLIHGADDDMCHVDDAGMLYNALKRLGQDVELAIYDGEGHVPYEWSRVNAVDALHRVLDFLDRHLSG